MLGYLALFLRVPSQDLSTIEEAALLTSFIATMVLGRNLKRTKGSTF